MGSGYGRRLIRQHYAYKGVILVGKDLVAGLELVWDGIRWLIPHVVVIGGAYCFSAWVGMVFWGMVAVGRNLTTISYLDTMLGMIALWSSVILVVVVVGRLQAIKNQLTGKMPSRYLQ